MKTHHPDHGIDEGRIGLTPDSHIDGRAKRWSWKCWCGTWFDSYPSRESARQDYNEHKETCAWAKARRARTRVNTKEPDIT